MLTAPTRRPSTAGWQKLLRCARRGRSSPARAAADLSTDRDPHVPRCARRADHRDMLRRIPLRPEPRPIPDRYVTRRRSQKRPVARHWETVCRAELLDAGLRPRAITAAVRLGRIVRARENVYLDPAADRDCIAACRVGGRLTCVSELARWGVFVLDTGSTHVDVPHTRSRLRGIPGPVVVHWSHRREDGWASVDIIDALVAATRCQSARAAIATLDSALYLCLIDESDLDSVFARLPRRLHFLRELLDGRAESGSETLMRLLLRMLGCAVQVQVRVDGVGRVDFLVDGWLIIECDSREFHESWDQQRKDKRRDQAAAARGMATYRPIAEDIFWHPERVVAAVRGLLALRS